VFLKILEEIGRRSERRVSAEFHVSSRGWN
jgi:hypothetical protein